MQDWAYAFYHSQSWLDCRQAYISARIGIDGGLCEFCRKNPGKIVHHKQWLTEQTINDPTVTLSLTNLAYICQSCHNEEHNGHRCEPRYRVDSSGCILPPSAP